MPIPNDTHPDAEAAQIRRLREMTVSQRLLMMRKMTSAAVTNAKHGIALARPELTERERELLFIEVHYGAELAERVRATLGAQVS